MITLGELIARLRVYLQDLGAILWSDEALTEAVRLALAEYNFSLQVSPADTLAGLDGAEVTSLPGGVEGLLLIGSIGYALESRSLKRNEGYDPSPDRIQLQAEAGAAMHKLFEAMLRLKAQEGLRTSSDPPWPAEGWPVDGREEPLP
jgi:hypothetical protein